MIFKIYYYDSNGDGTRINLYKTEYVSGTYSDAKEAVVKARSPWGGNYEIISPLESNKHKTAKIIILPKETQIYELTVKSLEEELDKIYHIWLPEEVLKRLF